MTTGPATANGSDGDTENRKDATMNELEKAMETIKDHMCTGETKGRCLVVLHRGWIFVGSLMKLDDGYMLTNCKNVRSWAGNGFGGLTKSANSAKLDPCQPIKFKDSAMIFYSPITEEWGNE